MESVNLTDLCQRISQAMFNHKIDGISILCLHFWMFLFRSLSHAHNVMYVLDLKLRQPDCVPTISKACWNKLYIFMVFPAMPFVLSALFFSFLLLSFSFSIILVCCVPKSQLSMAASCFSHTLDVSVRLKIARRILYSYISVQFDQRERTYLTFFIFLYFCPHSILNHFVIGLPQNQICRALKMQTTKQIVARMNHFPCTWHTVCCEANGKKEKESNNKCMNPSTLPVNNYIHLNLPFDWNAIVIWFEEQLTNRNALVDQHFFSFFESKQLQTELTNISCRVLCLCVYFYS